MARRKKRKSGKVATDLVSLEAGIKQLQSAIVHPDMTYWMYSGAAGGIRSKLLSIEFSTLRNIVHKVPLIGAIINTRLDQVLPYTKRSVERNEKGYKLTCMDPKLSDEKKKEEEDTLCNFIDQCGFAYDPEREDDFSDYAQMFVRDVLTIDQVATELQSNRKGEIAAFWALDAATIKRVDDNYIGYKKGVRFIQEIDCRVFAEYSHKNLLFDYKNKRSDIRYRGYGYSLVEQGIDIITTLLFGYNYIRDQFVRDRIPKGFISIAGDAGPKQIDAVRRYWYAAMSGAGGRWNIPILPSGKEGVGMDFKSIGQSNRDMEYSKTIMLVSSLIAAVFSIDLAEMGMKTDNSTNLIGETMAPRMQASKSRGTGAMLTFLSQHMNKILRKVTDRWAFSFVGYDIEDDERQANIDRKRVETDTTINDLREERGKEPIDADYANVVLNPQAIQIYMADESAQQQQEMAGEQPLEEGAGGEEEYSDEDWADLFKSKTGKPPKKVKVIIE